MNASTFHRLYSFYSTAKDNGIESDSFTRNRQSIENGAITVIKIGETTVTGTSEYNTHGDSILKTVSIDGPDVFAEDDTILSPELLELVSRFHALQPDVSEWTSHNYWTIQARENLSAQLVGK